MKFPTMPTECPRLPATRFINLFDRVKFHPLSIRVLTAQQLKTRRMAEVSAFSSIRCWRSRSNTSPDYPADLRVKHPCGPDCLLSNLVRRA